jgi:carbonic anhydrase/acetyltransferase-like protein (isoleucine patch superfamily)
MTLYRYNDRIPEISEGSYVAPSAQVIGRVLIGRDCYIGHGAILRGDYGTIEIGSFTRGPRTRP